MRHSNGGVIHPFLFSYFLLKYCVSPSNLSVNLKVDFPISYVPRLVRGTQSSLDPADKPREVGGELLFIGGKVLFIHPEI